MNIASSSLVQFTFLFVAGGLVAAVGVLGAARQLPRNRFAGIRSCTTMRSDAAWYAAHRAAASATIVGGAGFALIAVAPLWFDFLPALGSTIVAVVWLLAWMVVAAVQATRAAERCETLTDTESVSPRIARPNPRLVTLIILGLLAGCAGIYTSTVVQTSHTAALPPEHYDQLAVTDLTDIVAGNYDAVEAGLAPAVARQLPATALAQGWQSYQQLFGSYQSHGQPEDVINGDHTVVNVPLNMANQPGQFRITFDRSGRVAGLYLLRTGVPVPSP